MSDLEAIERIEGMTEATHDEVVEAYQHLIDSGTIRHLQGSYQRNASQLIANGWCKPPSVKRLPLY